MNEEMFEKIAQDAYTDEMEKIAFFGFGAKDGRGLGAKDGRGSSGAVKGRTYNARLARLYEEIKKKNPNMKEGALIAAALKATEDTCASK